MHAQYWLSEINTESCCTVCHIHNWMCEASLLYQYTVITSPAVVPIGYMTRFQWWVSGLEAISNVLDVLYRYMEMEMEPKHYWLTQTASFCVEQNLIHSVTSLELLLKCLFLNSYKSKVTYIFNVSTRYRTVYKVAWTIEVKTQTVNSHMHSNPPTERL